MSNFSEAFLKSELRLSRLRVACEGRRESIDRNLGEGHSFIARLLQRKQDEDLAELNIARREHFELLLREAEEKANERFEMARYMWVNGVAPYDDIDKYPDVESVLKALDAEESK